MPDTLTYPAITDTAATPLAARDTARPQSRPLRATTDTAALTAPVGPAGPTAATAPQWRDTTAPALFGETSVVVTPQHPALHPVPTLTTDAPFQGFVLLLTAIYALLIARHLGDVGLLLGRISRDTASGQRLAEDPGGSGFSRFLHIAGSIGVLLLGVVTVKYGDPIMPRSFAETLSHGAVLAMSLIASAACLVMIGYQFAAIRLTGVLTLSQPVAAQLLLLKKTYFALGVIVAAPALLLFVLCPPGTGGFWLFVLLALLAGTAILYLRETLNLFISKKISILHWFLYLCTVEIFPISLLWLSAVR